jgi:broad specificity phosphatase PhoE
MELLLIRHALPVRLAVGRPVPGGADPGLAARGFEQAERMAAFLAPEPINAVYVSPARRARQTAAPVAATVGCEPTLVEDLAEWDYGSEVYVPVEELRAAGDPRWLALERGEFYDRSVDQGTFRRRVLDAIDAIVADHPDGRVAIVTHSGVINAYAGHVLGQDKAFWLPLPRSPGYCSVSRIIVNGTAQRQIVSLNETGHVRDLLVP